MLLRDLYKQYPDQKLKFKIKGVENDNKIGYWCSACKIAVPIKNNSEIEVIGTDVTIKGNNFSGIVSLFMSVDTISRHSCNNLVEDIFLTKYRI